MLSSRTLTPFRFSPNQAIILPEQLHIKSAQRALDLFYVHGIDKFKRPHADRGMIDSLMPFWLQSSPSSVLGRGVTALSYACCSKEPGQKIMTRDAAFYYGRAVSMVANAIKDPDAAFTNDVILAVVTLGFYEVRKARYSDIAPGSMSSGYE